MRPLPRPRSLTRLAAGVAVLAAATLGVSACNASPYAAQVNHQVIKSSVLDRDLQGYTANTKLVAALSSQGAHVYGASTSSYNNSFVAGELTALIDAKVVSQYLTAHHLRVSRGLLDATRAIEQLTYGSDWAGFSPAYRASMVTQDAEHALIEPRVISTSELRQTYIDYRSRFWSTVCVRDLTITATGPRGRVDLAASRAQAQRLVTSVNRRSSASAADGVRGGSVGCYTPSQLEQQSFATQVLGLATYHASAPRRQSFGYQVLVVTRRHILPLYPTVAQALNGYYVSDGNATDTTLNRMLRASDIRVNPAYGSWDNARKVRGANATLASPGVIPPSAPNTAKRKPVVAVGSGSALLGSLTKP